MAGNEIYKKFSGMSDKEWVKLVIRSASESEIEGIKFPGLPDKDLQRRVISSSADVALRQGSKFYLEIKNYCSALGISFGDNTRILDFGCGFGRHVRFFLKDIPPESLIGVDVNENLISICRETLPMSNFKRIDPWPPLNFNNSHFDLIYAHSVFSHLDQQIANAWIKEFSRLLRSGGGLIVTTRSRRFIDYCADLRSETALDSFHKQTLAQFAFLDSAQSHRDYARGKYLFSKIEESSEIRAPDFYGEAIIPLRYVYDNWLDNYDLIDFVDDQSRLHQAMIILQRKTKVKIPFLSDLFYRIR